MTRHEVSLPSLNMFTLDRVEADKYLQYSMRYELLNIAGV
jgi:hypothetical protein